MSIIIFGTELWSHQLKSCKNARIVTTFGRGRCMAYCAGLSNYTLDRKSYKPRSMLDKMNSVTLALGQTSLLGCRPSDSAHCIWTIFTFHTYWVDFYINVFIPSSRIHYSNTIGASLGRNGHTHAGQWSSPPSVDTRQSIPIRFSG